MKSMSPMPHEKSFAYLDFLRGTSAFLVLIGHARAFCLESYVSGDAVDNIFSRAIYFITGFGHQSVMVFFVLSGFLIGRHVLGNIERGTWSWPGYLIDRLSRLWLVLIPCLLLTAALDYAGVRRDPLGFYQGVFQPIILIGAAAPGIDSTWSTAFANLFFLQKIISPVFGSNGPLWSLSYEFWYYLLFPLIALPVFSKQKWKWFCLFPLLGICVLMPKDILIYGLVWLTGAATAYLSRRISFTNNSGFYLLPFAISSLLATMVYSRLPQNSGVLVDIVIGLACGLLVLAIVARNWPVLPFLAPMTWLSRMSYSLYLVHMPVLAWIWVVPMHYQRQPFGWTAMSNMAVMIFSAIFFAWITYFCFEKNTNRVRLWCKRRILGRQ